jgi:hypothetical protein
MVAPAPKEHVLYVCECQRPLQERIVVQVNLTDRQMVGGAAPDLSRAIGVSGAEQPRLLEMETQKRKKLLNVV